MKHRTLLRVKQRTAGVSVGLVLALTLASCGLGEPMKPNPPTGVPADRSVGVVAPVPDPIPHRLDGRQECFACHAIGAVDAPAVPADHSDDETQCTICHAVWLAPAVAAAAPPSIPHTVQDRGDCLVCHGQGTAGAPRVPDNHSGLTSGLCQTCHTQAAAIGGALEPEAPIASLAPDIPHQLEGFSACTQCHERGGSGIPTFPADHVGRTDDLCSACHRPAESTLEAAPTIEPVATPAEVSAPSGDVANGQALFSSNCAICHGEDGVGTAMVPEALNDAALLTALSDKDISTTITTGVAGGMPPFAAMTAKDIRDLIAFMRSWQ